MKRLLYICDWLPPDFGAVGQYSLRFARERAAAGEDVVLAGLSSVRESIEEENVGGGRLRTLRFHRTLYDRADLVERALWTLRTNVTLVFRLRREIGAADEVLFTGSPPLLIHLIVPLNLLFRRRLTYRITDFYPECLMAERDPVPLWLRVLHRLTIALRRRVHRFEVLGEDQRERLRALGISAERIELKRDPSPVAIPLGTQPLPVPESLRGRVVLLYSGNFGVAHDHATFAKGYASHHRQGSGRVGLWLNATGSGADALEAVLRSEGLPFHRSRPIPIEDLPRLLVTPAAHLITLKDAFVGYVLPSKVHGCVLSQRDVLFVGSARSDVHLLCAEGLPAGAYHRIEVGDVNGARTALETIADRANHTTSTPTP
jgi:hypothetical protein